MSDKDLRQHLVKLMKGGQAHCTFEHAVAAMPAAQMGQTADGMPHSPWQVLEHLRFTQKDILDFSRDPKYKTPAWPDDYWPKDSAPPTSTAWKHSVDEVKKDLSAMCKLVEDPATDLFAPIPWGDGQTILREALLVADHNAYHLGQLVTLRRILGAWKE